MGRYLVTGGAGFIGSHLVDSLLADGHAVRVLDNLSSGAIENLPPGVDLMICDVTEQQAVRRGLDGVDGCFHLAAIASVERGRREWLRSHLTNLAGTITVFEEALRVQRLVGRPLPVVYASSAAVYGDTCDIPIAEEAPTRPISAYGVDKLGCELHAAAAARVHDLRTVGLRLFNVYGPRQDANSPYSGVISIFCQRIMDGMPLEIHGDGSQTRDFVYVQDAVDALHLAMQSAARVSAARVFNVCTGVGTSVRQLAELICGTQGVAFSPRYSASRSGDVRISVGSPLLAREQLDFTAWTPLKQGLGWTLESMYPVREPARAAAVKRVNVA